jgi:hypothetical protein
VDLTKIESPARSPLSLGGLRCTVAGPTDGSDDRGMADVEVPQYHELLWPTLQAVSELGGSASISEIMETVIKREGFTDEQQSVLHNNGPNTETAYRLAWARTYLKGMRLLANSARGVWTLTDEGTALLTDPTMTGKQRRQRVRELWAAYVFIHAVCVG